MTSSGIAFAMSPFPAAEKIIARLGPIHKETVLLQGREFFLLKPTETHKLLTDPGADASRAAEEYVPYWADIWPASRMLGKVLLGEALTPGTCALEIGCGLGLPGIVALRRGLHVTFTDNDPCALHFASENARLNGFTDFATRHVDWRDPPADFQFPLLLGADLLYEMRYLEPLIGFIRQALLPGGVCLLTDQDRLPGQALRDQLEAEGLTFTTEIVRAGEPGGRRSKGTLYRIRNTE